MVARGREAPTRRGGAPRTDAVERASSLSYAVAAASGALVLALLAYLTAQALVEVPPAAIQAAVVERQIEERGGAYYVPLEVRNAGGAPARDVAVEATLLGGHGAGPATARMTIDYLAGGESQRLYAVFSGDPRGGRVVARVVGYREP